MSSTSDIPSDPIGAKLDQEINSLRSQITALKAQRKFQTTAILSSRTAASILSRLQADKAAPKTAQAQPEIDFSPLQNLVSAQQAHVQENLYRACASITTFRVNDPDPSVGPILGLRIDVSSIGKFVSPYYIFFTRPHPGMDSLHIHRHTVPPRIPLDKLAAKHLPAPKVDGEIVKPRTQNLNAFVSALRREAVGYHNRIGVIKGLRKEFQLDHADKKGKGREKVISDISAADAEAKQVKIEWVDGRIGRCVVDERGEVIKCVVIGENGRDREVERMIVGSEEDRKMEGIGERLKQGIY